jgi:hypothetical protein
VCICEAHDSSGVCFRFPGREKRSGGVATVMGEGMVGA